MSRDEFDPDVKLLIEEGRKKGYLTYEEINRVLPDDIVSPEKLDGVLMTLDEMGIRLLDETDVPIPASVVNTSRTSDGSLNYEKTARIKINNDSIDPSVFTPEYYGFKRSLPRKQSPPWFVKLVGAIALVTTIGGAASVCLGKTSLRHGH